MFKAPRHLEPLQLRDRELPGSEAIEAFLNNPNLANADRKFLEMADQQLRASKAPVADWDGENRVSVGTGIFREKVCAVAVPVNA